MGFGLMGAGAAVSGLVDGYQKGRKFAQDEERFDMEKEKFGLEKKAAEQVGRLRDEQIKGAGLTNTKAQRELDDDEHERNIQNDVQAIIKDYNAKIAAHGSQPQAPSSVSVQPQAAGVVGPSTQPQAGGISLPGGAAPSSAVPAPTANRHELTQEMMTKVLEKQLESRKANRTAIWKDIIAASRFAQDQRAQDLKQAFDDFKSGVPQDQIMSNFAARGTPIQDGASFRMIEAPMPGMENQKDAPKFKQAQLVFPDGRTLTDQQHSMKMLNPEELLKHGSKVSELAATMDHYARVDQRMLEQSKATASHYRTIEAEQKKQSELAARRLGLEEGKFEWDRYMSNLKTAREESFRLTGFQPLTPDQQKKLEEMGSKPGDGKGPIDPKTGKPRDRTWLEIWESDNQGKFQASLMMFDVYDRNYNPKHKPNISLPQAKQAVEIAVNDPSKIQSGPDGYFVEVDKTQAFLPGALVNKIRPPAESPATAGATPGAAPTTPPTAGIAPPPLPPQYSGLAARGFEESRRVAEESAKSAAAKQADAQRISRLKDEARGFTPDVIRVMEPREADRVLREYGQVLTGEQRRMINRQM